MKQHRPVLHNAYPVQLCDELNISKCLASVPVLHLRNLLPLMIEQPV